MSFQIKKTLAKIPLLIVFLLAAALSLAVFSCNVASESGHTYLTVNKNAAWDTFDSIEIAWKDPLTGAGGVLYQGKPSNLKAVNKFQADAYQGQKIDISFKGFNAKKLAYEEKRGFDGANPTVITRVIVPIDSPVIIPPPIITPPAKPSSPTLTRIHADTLISIHDSIPFSSQATIDSGTLKSYAWDYQGTGIFTDSNALVGKTSPILGGYRYHAAGTFTVTLRVFSVADSMTKADLKVTVLQDEPVADAGADLTVYVNAPMPLHGKAKDGLGRIVKTEWKIGAGLFTAAPGDTTYTAPAAPQDVIAVFRVTDDDTLSAMDTVVIHVISPTESNLTGIAVTAGKLSPQFNPTVITYTDTVEAEVAVLTLTPTGNGTIQVNGVTVVSGQGSSVNLVAGLVTTISVAVQGAGAVGKEYAIAVYRRLPSTDASLKTLTVSAGALNKTFTSGDTVYSVTVPSTTTSTTVTATVSNATSTLKINGVAVASGVASGLINLTADETPVKVVVTAQNGATKSYGIQIIRAKNGNADLSALVLSAGAISGVFAPQDVFYSLSVANTVTTTTVTATVANTTSTLTINGKPATSGSPFAVNLSTGPNTITVSVTAQDGSLKSYVITVTRAKNTDATLSALVTSAGTLTPSPFASATTAYTASVANTVTSITVTATTAAATSTLAIKTVATASGSPSAAIPLDVGANTIAVVVTAESGATKTYTLTITRTGNADATLSDLVISAGTLTPSPFVSATTAYTSSVANTVTSTTVTATTSAATSTITIKGVATTSGSSSATIALSVGSNAIPVVVTAQSGATKTYTITITRAGNGDATLSDLAISASVASSLVFDPSTMTYDLTVKNKTASTTVTATVAASTSSITIKAVAATSGTASGALALTVGVNSIPVVVTAQSGATKTYTLRITRCAKAIGIAAGVGNAILLREDGTVFDWGMVDFSSNGVKKPAGLTGVQAVSAGNYHIVALKNDGTVVAWGQNDYGQATVPSGLTGVIAISAGYSNTYALKSNGTVVSWGDTSYASPSVIRSMSGIQSLTGQFWNGFAFKADGSYVSWGANTGNGIDSLPSGLVKADISAMAIGSGFAVVVKKDGTLVAWGNNSDGQTTIPSGLAGVKAVGAGQVNTVVLKQDGTMAAWGYNDSGQSTIPAGLTGVTAMGASTYNTYALKSDGTLVAWGSTNSFLTTVPWEFSPGP